MLNSTATNSRQYANQYLVKEILEASPQQLLIKIYDFAIINCQRKDHVKTNNAIQELINALNFEDESAKEISVGLFRLYHFCQEEMRKKNFDTVYTILTDLRDTWKKAFNM